MSIIDPPGISRAQADARYIKAVDRASIVRPRPLISAADFYNMNLGETGVTFSLAPAGALKRQGGSGTLIKVDASGAAGNAFCRLRMPLQRAIRLVERNLSFWLYVPPTYLRYGAVTPTTSLELRVSPDADGLTNYKMLPMAGDTLHPGWNKIVISPYGGFYTNGRDWVTEGTVAQGADIQYITLVLSIPSAIPALERVFYLDVLSLEPTASDIPTVMFNSDQYGASGVVGNANMELLDYMESVGAQSYLTGRTFGLSNSPARLENALLRQSRGWDICQMGNGIDGVDVNWSKYNEAYPTGASRLAAFQTSREQGSAYLASVGLEEVPFFQWPQNSPFYEGLEYLFASGYKLQRSVTKLPSQDDYGWPTTQWIHAQDFGSDGSLGAGYATYANTYSQRIRQLLDNGGVLNFYWHDVVPDDVVPNSSNLQQRIREIKRTVDACVLLQQLGYLRIAKPRNFILSSSL